MNVLSQVREMVILFILLSGVLETRNRDVSPSIYYSDEHVGSPFNINTSHLHLKS